MNKQAQFTAVSEPTIRIILAIAFLLLLWIAIKIVTERILQ